MARTVIARQKVSDNTLCKPERGVTMLENGLYQYRGGGYDGCYWEWNYAAIIEGEFHDIFSSGHSGCPTIEELELAAEEQAEAIRSAIETGWYVYPLTVEGLTEYANASEPGSALAVIAALEKLGVVFDIRLTCAECECVVSLDEMQASGLVSAGGCTYQHTHLVCFECYAALEGGY